MEMIHYRIIGLNLIIITLLACGGTKEIMVEAPLIEEETLDTLIVSAPPLTREEEIPVPQELPPYNPSATRHMDILHTTLDLKFNWEKQWVLGKAEIEMTPLFYPQYQVILDAKGFDINSISMGGGSLEYSYDNSQLSINLGKVFYKEDTIKLLIDYVAKPNEGLVSGSAAITSDKGLFFINPLGDEPGTPMQIWTQGETENNSRWFPTFDKPNERMTQEIRLTVDNRFATLSNGSLISSRVNNDGTRTDTWKQDLPHAPYLVMIAVGEFAVVKENVDGLEYMYYVEEAYGPHAKKIFDHTPEMIAFFSEKLNYPFPWSKYAQIVTRDYVSGAMENTTAVIFGDFVQKTTRELIDNGNDYIVAHEMFHHWFGDLVTCESWANLTLQEGFANYSEYLWYEYKYGLDRADKHRMGELEGYLMSAQNQGTHPLIHYAYDNKESMFDAHSYNKGGLVLHMLRSLVGDEAFYAALNKYLIDNKFSDVEVDELRMAFEDITGQDLQWFFDQWYLSAGHPRLEVSYQYMPELRKQIIKVDQVQDPDENLPVYRLFTEIAIYDPSGEVTFYPVEVDTRSTQLEIENIDQPSAVVYDGKGDLLAVILESRTVQENIALLKYSKNYEDRINAARSLRRSAEFSSLKDILLADPHEDLRKIGVDLLDPVNDPRQKVILLKILTEDPHSSVRNAALEKLADLDYAGSRELLIDVLKGDDAYIMVTTALRALNKNDDPGIYEYAGMYRDVTYPPIMSELANIYASSRNRDYLSYFEKHLPSISIFSMFNFYNKYYQLLSDQSPEVLMEAAEKLETIAISGANMFRRFVATSTINKIEDNFLSNNNSTMAAQVRAILDRIISEEKEEQLIARYRSF